MVKANDSVTLVRVNDGATGPAGTSYWVSHEWIDVSASTYDQDTYYPVVGSGIPRNGTHRIKTSVQLNSGTKPKWSTHNAGFSVDLDIQTQASGWGTTHAVTYILLDDYDWCVSGAPSPVSFVQKSEASAPVLYLRGGGKYYVETTYSCSWSIKASEYYTYQGTTKKGPVSPTKTRPAVEGKPIKGDKGDKGDQGIQGPKGDPGKDGKSPTVSVSKSGTVTTIVVTNADGSKTTQTVNDGVNGTPGAKGADGRTTYFHVKYSDDGGKTFTANSGETVGTYIGTCTDYNSADPTTVGSYTWARIKGDTGAKGDTGKGATSIIEQYYLSTSSTTQAGGSWSTTQPTWSSGKYIWTRSHITWTDGTTTDTTPVLAGGLNSANQNAFNANNTANNANNTANNANNTADSAKSIANSAQSTANSAQSTANCKNAIFYATSAPSGSHKVNDVWFDTSHGYKMYYWNGSSWATGLFGTDSIKDQAITGRLIAGNTITGDKIVGRTITAEKIAAGAITANEIYGGTITADKINMNSLQANLAYVGNKSGRHIEIASDAVKLMLDGSTILGSFGSGGISLGNVFSVDPSGNGAYSGKITAKSGTIGGWTIDSVSLSRSTVSGSRTTKSLLADGKYAIYGNETSDNVVYNVDHIYDFVGLNYTRSWKVDDLSYKTSAIIGYNDSTYSDYIFHMYNTGTTEEILMQHGGIRMTGDLRVGADSTWAPGSYPAHLGGNVRANTFNSIELKNLIKTKYLTASNKKFVKNGSSNNTISVPTMSGYNIMGVYAATIDSDKVYPYNSYYDAGNKIFHVLGHNISGADVTTAIHGIAFYIANV